MSMILDYDPLTGQKVTVDYHHDTDGITIKHEQDCSDLIDDNQRLVVEADHTQQIKNDWIRYARVPYVVIQKWKHEYNVDFFSPDPAEWKKVMALINSSEWSRGLKTTKLYHDR